MLLRGLKQYTDNITAIVTMADDGGSSGILREEMGMLPPGDIRNCIIASFQCRARNAENNAVQIQGRESEGSEPSGILFLQL